jgi:hypothetical protein
MTTLTADDAPASIGAPPRLNIQVYPSTNTLLITFKEDIETVSQAQQHIFDVLSFDITELQYLDFNLFELLRQVRASFFDVRKAQSTFVLIQIDPLISVEFDHSGGTNRSVVLPRGSVTLDIIHSRMSEYGEIEKIWTNVAFDDYDPLNVVVDFYDSRIPLNIVKLLEIAV